MATLCRNCGHALVFDPSIQLMRCKMCGSAFRAEDVESQAKKYRENERVMTKEEIFGDDEVLDEYLECYVYTCSECGGEIMIHGSETSSKCVYCGNPNVVFSRVAKEKRPDYIIPFAITREQALASVNRVVSEAAFAPQEVKNFTPEDIRGIYIPYWLVNANHEEAVVIRSNQNTGMYKYRFFGRTGTMRVQNFPIDGCQILSDESSTRLEPFDLSAMRPFDEDYLLGFYSNSSDITYEELHLATMKRAKEIFDKAVVSDVTGKSPKVIKEVHETSILRDYKYAMFPVWFVTFRCDGKPHTILINGQTGKVVCGIPYDQKKVKTITILLGFLITAAVIGITFGLLYALGFRGVGKDSANSAVGELIIGTSLLFGTGFLLTGLDKIRKVKKQLKLTQADTMFRFVKKRQG